MKRIINIDLTSRRLSFHHEVIDVKSTGLTETQQDALIGLFRFMIIDVAQARRAFFEMEDLEAAHRLGLAGLHVNIERFEMETDPVMAYWVGVFEGDGKRLEIQSTLKPSTD